VNRPQCNLQLLESFGVALIVGTGLSACVGLPVLGGTTWKEGVLLHDGSTITVTRSVERGGRHEIAQKPPYKEQSLIFTLPKSNKLIRWGDHFSEDIGTSSFMPMALDVYDGIPFLVSLLQKSKFVKVAPRHLPS
jgi:hypothetical protein